MPDPPPPPNRPNIDIFTRASHILQLECAQGRALGRDIPGCVGQIRLARRPDQRVLLLPPLHHDARTRREETNDKRASNGDANDEWHVQVVGRVGQGRLDSDSGHLLNRDAQRDGGVADGAEGGGERGLHLVGSLGGGHGDAGGDAHAGGGHADRDERLVDARGVSNLLLQARLVVARVVADAAAGSQREHDRLRRGRRRRRGRRAGRGRRRRGRRGRGRRGRGRRGRRRRQRGRRRWWRWRRWRRARRWWRWRWRWWRRRRWRRGRRRRRGQRRRRRGRHRGRRWRGRRRRDDARTVVLSGKAVEVIRLGCHAAGHHVDALFVGRHIGVCREVLGRRKGAPLYACDAPETHGRNRVEVERVGFTAAVDVVHAAVVVDIGVLDVAR
eukprot:scaffold52955_cov45-Phaeocystis_antarctica.AAC.3